MKQILTKHNQSQYKEEPYHETHYVHVLLLSPLNPSSNGYKEDTMDILSEHLIAHSTMQPMQMV